MSTDLRQTIGAQIRALREAKELSTRALAEAARTNNGHIVRIEQGKYNIRLDTLDSILQALDARLTIERKRK